MLPATLLSPVLLLSSLFFSTTTHVAQANPMPAINEVGLDEVSFPIVNVERAGFDDEDQVGGFAMLNKRIVYNPPITSPVSTTMWHTNTTQTVRWNTTGIPSSLKNATSHLKLGYIRDDKKGGYNLNWTLAKGFKLKAGKVSFEVPAKLKSRDDYIVVLFGDSGNRSKKFSITSVGDI